MTHAEMDELYELYVLSALDREEAASISEHLREQCMYCSQRVREALLVTAALSGVAESQEPPAALKRRILASVGKSESRKATWWPALAGLAAACAALLAVVLWTYSTLQRSQGEIAALQAERTQLREALQILSQRETKTVQFGKAAEQPYGRVLVNPGRGLVFVGSQLPQLASDRTFQLWLIPKTGAPESAGVFQGALSGAAVQVRNTPVNTGQVTAVAVSVEPLGGSPAPTTKPILVIPLG